MEGSAEIKSPGTVAIQLALDAYNLWQAVKNVPGMGEERRSEYELKRASLNSADCDLLDEEIKRIYGHGAAPETPSGPVQIIAGEKIVDMLKGSLSNPNGGDEE